jgi:hypothetical protein
MRSRGLCAGHACCAWLTWQHPAATRCVVEPGVHCPPQAEVDNRLDR